MAERTAIEWCDSTWNPWLGCTKIGPGCDHCYAEALMDTRHHRAKWGAGQPRVRTSPANWRKPLQWNREAFYQCRCGWRGEDPDDHVGDSPACSRGSVQVRRRVFCASLADVFDNEVPQGWREDLFRLIWNTPSLDWLLLTKRIGNVSKMLADIGIDKWTWPWTNVWLGATVVNQEEADRDIPKLLAVPARVRFLSIEPMLGPVDLRAYLGAGQQSWGWCHGLSWVIVGGESGPKARPLHVEWVESLVEQCRAVGVPCMVKQLGNAPAWSGMGGPWPANTRREDTGRGHFAVSLRDRKGGDINEWPERLRVRQFPQAAL